MPAPVASGWSGRRAGLAPAGKAPPCHGARGARSFAGTRRDGAVAPISAIHGLPGHRRRRYGLNIPELIEASPIRVITVPSGNVNVVLPPELVEVATMLLVVVMFSFW